MRKSWPTEAAALSWGADVLRMLDVPDAPESTATLGEFADLIRDGMESGKIKTRGGRAYKPSVCRGYDLSMRTHVLPYFGDGKRLVEITDLDMQAFVDHLQECDAPAKRKAAGLEGLHPSTIRNALMPLRLIHRRAKRRKLPVGQWFGDLELPEAEASDRRAFERGEVLAMLAALSPADRALWGCAYFTGLRLGELRALKWEYVDLAERELHVVWAMDATGATIAPKSAAGVRAVPMPSELVALLSAHREATWDHGYVFGSSAGRPFSHSAALTRAHKAWDGAGLPRAKMHEMRHSYASWVIDMDTDGSLMKALSVWMGHSSIAITMNLYAKVLKSTTDRARDVMDAYHAAPLITSESGSGASGDAAAVQGGARRVAAV